MSADNRNLLLKSVFEGDTVYFETVLPIKGEETPLLFPIKKIISLKDYSLNKEYIEGKDFFVKDGKLIIPDNSDIPTLEVDEYYIKEQAAINIKYMNGQGPYHFDEQRFLIFGEGSYMSDKQISITYTHDGKWDLFRQTPQREKVSRFISKLKNKEPVNLVFFGDSITVGCNASGSEYGGNKAPFTEPWPVMIHKYLEEKYHTHINYVNTAVGGMTSNWGRDNYEERVNQYKPDLLILAFGMNDGIMPKDKHLDNILTIINGARKENPNLEVVLVSTTLPNTESNWFTDGIHSQYVETYMGLNLPYIAVCDMTHMHLDLLKRKRFKDMSGNNINHPNDFLIRIYAQSILEVLGE